MPLSIFLTGTDLAGRGTTLRGLSVGGILRLRATPDQAVLRSSVCGMDTLLRCRVRTPIAFDPILDRGVDERVAADAHFLAEAAIVVYVVDSQRERSQANAAGVTRLMSTLQQLGRTPESVHVVFQLNKRDLQNSDSRQTLEAALRWPSSSFVETVATSPRGLELLEAHLEARLAGFGRFS